MIKEEGIWYKLSVKQYYREQDQFKKQFGAINEGKRFTPEDDAEIRAAIVEFPAESKSNYLSHPVAGLEGHVANDLAIKLGRTPNSIDARGKKIWEVDHLPLGCFYNHKLHSAFTKASRTEKLEFTRWLLNDNRYADLIEEATQKPEEVTLDVYHRTIDMEFVAVTAREV